MDLHNLQNCLRKHAVPEVIRAAIKSSGFEDPLSWSTGIDRANLGDLFLAGTTFALNTHAARSATAPGPPAPRRRSTTTGSTT